MNITPSTINQPTGIVGIPEGISYGQNERVDELNTRIFGRFHPDRQLQPNFSINSVQTKYAHFPVIDRRVPANTSINVNPTGYATGEFFVPPIGARGPVAGFLDQVNTESVLRNQCFALQRGADQAVYVPSSNSDMYRVSVSPTTSGFSADDIARNSHPELFYRHTFDQAPNPNVANAPGIGRDIFMNNTRTQLRNIVNQG